MYLLELQKTADSRSFIRVDGVASVAMMTHIPSLDVIVLITDKQRALSMIRVADLNAHRHDNPPTVTLTPVDDVSTTHPQSHSHPSLTPLTICA